VLKTETVVAVADGLRLALPDFERDLAFKITPAN